MIIFIYLFILSVIFLICYYILPLLYKVWVKRDFNRAILCSGVVCLTFDDGPDPEATPQILDLLDSAGIKASFFVLGEKAAQYPCLVREIAKRGHEIGSH